MAMVKSGWLHRQSSILRRWKSNWFDLWADGRLLFYKDQQRRDLEDELHMRVHCINIRSCAACQELSPPQGRTRDALFQIVCRDGRVVSLCADGADDALAWTLALQDARINTVGFAQEVVASAPPPYSEHVHPQVYSPGPYGDYSASPAHPTQIVYSADGQPYAVAHPYPYQYPYQHQHQYQGGYVSPGVNHVVIQERQRDSGGDMALGMLAGAATGLALGSFFSVF
ncbi:pleckstrin homology domain-containing family B member 2 isoform X2 [Austrofundulus limnaeus]|uniref:Pleckstrin homology domain-containing family B member 2 isoform X2 n=1 Tax=Austrofundulus limnaeus TaxID=52670 RepID=A0A2I4DC63_AUSLI|nr:PREDICTED: pleckstrin homology domain-containing family B member 2 isoform X2 [Austrofundulus limnaeus]XP_013889844.1 PREDICTED: pleckstrin homology domain-containing family B member 2 isoform X2 [Austrofundulus limnaeus]